MDINAQCSQQIVECLYGATWEGHLCTRNSVVFVSGKGYCKQHSPEEVTRREKERLDFPNKTIKYLRRENEALRKALECVPRLEIALTDAEMYRDWYYGPRKDALEKGQ